LAETVPVAPAPTVAAPAPASPKPDAAAPELVVFGGTGFIGTHLIAQLVAAGRPVRVVSRGADAGNPPFNSPLVEIMRGDVSKRADVERAIAGAKLVVNLAHGGGGSNWAEIKRTMVDSAVAVVECAKAAGVKRLVHVGSIAGLWLGDPKDVITGATPPDPESEKRNLYARGKAEADRALMALAGAGALEIVILRPGLVVGEGTAALHGGLGFFNNEQHVIGWNGGTNPLPFVLVEDVANAIIRALDAPSASGKAYNLVGDVRPTAREFVQLVAQATARPIKFHPQSVDWLQTAELFKWGIKRATGKSVDVPAKRDLESRGLTAQFDCSDAKHDLGWLPVSDRARFIARAVDIHRTPFERAP
jgi:nucleoside-diphosphate-sugar epimerase